MNRSERLGTRVRPQDKEVWQAAATHTGISLSAWVEKVLNEEAKKVLAKPQSV